MYSFTVSATIAADPADVWAVWTDPDRFPEWDPREVRTSLAGPFAVGSTIDSKQRGVPGGTATISAVEDSGGVRRWAVTSELPGGSLAIDHSVTPAPGGGTLVGKEYVVTGPMTLLFRLYFGPLVRRAMPGSFAALDVEAGRRTPSAAGG